MRWQSQPDNKPFYSEIKVGESDQLFVCGLYQERVHHYAGDTLNNIDLSETLVENNASRRLEIHLFDGVGRKYVFPIMISAETRRNHADKVQVQIRTKTTFSERISQFRSGFREMISAFTRPNY